VEFALVAPVFLACIFGILEIGRLVMVQQVLTTASREGARVAILDGSSTADVEAAVNNYLESTSISGATVSSTPNPLSTAQPGDAITVTVTVPFEDVSWVSSPWFFEDVTLSAGTLMRREGIR
jgi:Flp pilus assembly protein TadG